MNLYNMFSFIFPIFSIMKHLNWDFYFLFYVHGGKFQLHEHPIEQSYFDNRYGPVWPPIQISRTQTPQDGLQTGFDTSCSLRMWKPMVFGL